MKMSLRDGLKLSLSMLTKRDQKLLFLAFLVQISLSVLDLIGIGAIAAVVSITVSVIQGSDLPNLVLKLFDSVSFDYSDPYQTVLVLGSMAAVILIIKTILSALISRWQLQFLANRDALAATKLLSELLKSSVLIVQKRQTQETIYALTVSVYAATVTFLGNLLIVSTEISLLFFVTVALLLIDPLVTIGAILLFGLLGLVLQKSLGAYAQRLGQESNVHSVTQASSIQVSISAFRELSVMQRQGFFNEKFSTSRWQSSKLAAQTLFASQVSRYAYEIALVFGAFSLAMFQFLLNSAVVALTTLSLFLAAATRLLPSMLRLQSGLISMRNSIGKTAPLRDLKSRIEIERSELAGHFDGLKTKIRQRNKGAFEVELKDVHFSYGESEKSVLNGLTLTIPAGSSLGIIGKSGSGKTTLVDILLGVLKPESGTAKVNNLDPLEARKQYPGDICYVPQDIILISGTIEENVTLGLYPDQYELAWVWEALKSAKLYEFVKSLPEQLDTEVGERGVRLSGGQRQRIGLARAMLSQPSLLILDEATSSLDVETESEITDALTELPHAVTKIVIAHRLATIQKLDQICILEDGKITQLGSFEELRKLDNILANQADLLSNN
jgi:ABC-type multidrug transport system fused ATPase/permease subunit